MKNNNLIRARENKNLTQTQLALMVGKAGKSAVSNWENGYSAPQMKDALLLSEILEEDVRFLFGNKVQVTHTKEVVCT